MEQYTENYFDQIWNLLNIQNDGFLGIRWSDTDPDILKQALEESGLEIMSSASPALLPFSYAALNGEKIEGSIGLISEKRVILNIHFVFGNAFKLITWLGEKYGQATDVQQIQGQTTFIWETSDLVVTLEVSKSTNHASVGIESA
jgi:hypothetical protein